MDRENARRKPRLEAGGLRRAGRSEWAGFRFGWSEIRAVRACVVTSTPWSVRARAESRGGRLVAGSARLGTRVSDGRGILGRAGLEAGWDEGVRVGWADDDALFRAGGSGFAGMRGPHAAPLRPCSRERVRACRGTAEARELPLRATMPCNPREHARLSGRPGARLCAGHAARERATARRKDSGGAGIAIARNDAMQPERARPAGRDGGMRDDAQAMQGESGRRRVRGTSGGAGIAVTRNEAMHPERARPAARDATKSGIVDKYCMRSNPPSGPSFSSPTIIVRASL